MRLLNLPVTVIRVPIEFGVGVAKRVGGTAAGAARGAYGLVAGGEETVVEEPRATPPPPRRRRPRSGNGRPRETATAGPARPQARPPRPEPPAPERHDAPAPAPEEPAHVGEEPELVAEAAEEGAEDGAGAEVTVEEPWAGYDRMNAADIEDRLVAEGAETAAAVSLYEASRKGRASVLEAASRSMNG
jgi:hypothetical protein